jgi:selenophosphate synthase
MTPAVLDRILSKLPRQLDPRLLVGFDQKDDAIHSVTDVTEFGFLGHALEMNIASRVSLRVDSRKIEFLEGALECVREGFIAGGFTKNREFISDCARFDADSPPEFQVTRRLREVCSSLSIGIRRKRLAGSCSRTAALQ